uniref:Uncharacterized protein n=1 Tax=Heterosigma akashiwo TaxID=2829 RepID=A0A7S3XZV3_HETAK|mmetsp:Transcript_32421/g.52746  ORF Transcript_32421/g.52746 Transcript_32421/m.52746 type:complete len:360 (+) Transcript_32421:17-1096(+)
MTATCGDGSSSTVVGPNHSSGCPSRSLCYEDVDSGVPGCLCNRVHLFFGEDCNRVHLLAFFTTFFYTLHALYVLYSLVYTNFKLCRPRQMSTVNRTFELQDFVCCSLMTFVMAIWTCMYTFDLYRLFAANLDDRWWESKGAVILTSVALFLATLHITVVAQIFLKTLVSVLFVRQTGSKFWQLVISTHQRVSVIAFGSALWYGIAQFYAIVFFVWVLTMAITILIMTWAAVKTTQFLEASDIEIMQLSAVVDHKSLFSFISSFRTWVALSAISALCLTVTDSLTNITPVVPHLIHGVTLASLNQLGLCVADYFLLPGKRKVRPLAALARSAVRAMANGRSYFFSPNQQIAPGLHSSGQF